MAPDPSSGLLVDRLAWERKQGSPISFAIAPGSRVYVCGDAASSLLLAVAGFLPSACARLSCDGRDLRGVPAPRRHVAYIAAGDTLLHRRSVLGNVTLSGASRASATACLGAVGLLDHASRLAGTLTPGQRRLAALARGLAAQPALLLIDEAQDDAPAIPDILGAIARPAALVATANPALALSRADRILLLRDGDVAQFGAPRDLYERPASVAAALWSGDCNLIPVTLDGQAPQPGRVAARFGPDLVSARFRDRLMGEAVLAVRPHALRLDPAGAPATIHRIDYRGATTRLALIAHGVSLSLDTPRPEGLSEGGQVRVAWDWSDAWPVSP